MGDVTKVGSYVAMMLFMYTAAAILMLRASAWPKIRESVEWERADMMPLIKISPLTRSISSSEYLEVTKGISPAATMNSAVVALQTSPTIGMFISHRSTVTDGHAFMSVRVPDSRECRCRAEPCGDVRLPICGTWTFSNQNLPGSPFVEAVDREAS